VTPFALPGSGPRPSSPDFNGGRLTTEAGALLFREVAPKLGLFEALDRAITDPRWLPIVIHDQRSIPTIVEIRRIWLHS
jgi:hypothetical protein